MTEQYGAPLTGAQMKLLMAAGLPDGTYKAVTRTSAIAGSLKYADFSIAADFFLPHDSPAYTLAKAGWLDGRNVALWFGGESWPNSWLEGSDIIRRDGTVEEGDHLECWRHNGDERDIIAYIRKAEGLTTHADRVLADAERAAKRMGGELGQNELWKAFKNASPATLALPADVNDTPKMPPARHTASQPETVTIAKMTETEAEALWMFSDGTKRTFVDRLRQLGLIREPTRLERFRATRDTKDVYGPPCKAFQLIEEALNFER